MNFDPQESTILDIEQWLKVQLENMRHPFDECRHFKVVLDEEAHTVQCQQCKKQLDPFWYLQLLAREWQFRCYRDLEALKAWHKLEEKERNAKLRRKQITRPQSGQGQTCWDAFQKLHDTPPDYVYYRGGWYAAKDDITELLEYIQMQLARKAMKAEVKE